VPAPRARQISPTAAERRRLTKLACSRTAPCQQVIRVRIVLDASRGYASATIARRRGVAAGTVRLWRGRYAREGMAGLAGPGPDARRRSPRSRSPRSKRWPASCRPRPGCHYRGGAAPTWPPR
jgi:hypothetical protein